MTSGRRLKMVAGTLAAAAMTLAVAGGCSGAGKTTCADYAVQDAGTQTSTVAKMIKEHGLDPASNAFGAAHVSVDVGNYCGLTAQGLSSEPATAHKNSPIEDGVDWSTYGG